MTIIFLSFQMFSFMSNQTKKSVLIKMLHINLHQWLLEQIFLQIQIFLQWSPFKKLMKWTVMFVHKKSFTILDQDEAFVLINLKSNVNPICGKKNSVWRFLKKKPTFKPVGWFTKLTYNWSVYCWIINTS